MKPLDVETCNGVLAIEDGEGAGTPLLLLHGAISNLRAWDRVIGGLGSGFRCVAVDLPVPAGP